MAGRVALIEVADVARLFQGIVAALAETDPRRLHGGFEVAELYQQIVPYRTHRSLLGFASHQDYDAAILGLLAGVGNYARVEPDEVRQTLAAEVDSPNPDPTLFREFAGARVRLAAGRVREVMSDGNGYAPPAEAPDPAPAAPPRAPAFELAEESAAPASGAAPRPPGAPLPCTACGAALPTDRPVVFCPHCGAAVGAPTCARCGDQLQPGWKFCPRCGAPQSA